MANSAFQGTGTNLDPYYKSGGTDVALADGGTGASLTDPGADSIMFWDESANAVTWLTCNTAIAIDGTQISVVVASQSDQETSTSNTVCVTPGRQHFHPSAAKCWVKADVAAGLTASYNITSNTDGGAGICTITIATDFSSANWACVTGGLGTGTTVTTAKAVSASSQAAGSVVLSAYDFSATPVLEDPSHFFMAGFGDHA